jgi:hypothetical protein
MNKFEIPKYSPLVLEYIVAQQRNALVEMFGLGFESKLNDIFPSQNNFLDYIDRQLDAEFIDQTEEKIDIEIQMKNSALDEVSNATKFEFHQHKALLNMAEEQFRKAVNPEYLDKIPYSATLHSFAPDAEIIPYEALDKPIIYFHGGLFSANLMFCKLYAQLIKDTQNEDDLPFYTRLSLKDDPNETSIAAFNSCYFYNYYFSSISDKCPTYNLETPFENSILATFLNSIAFYIYAHETGHWLLGHKNSVSTEQSWKDEFDADYMAMIHMQNYGGIGSSNILTLIGPIVFFRFRQLLEKYDPSLGKKDTHPPTEERIERYVDFLQKKIHVNDKQVLKNFLRLEKDIFNFLSDTFDKIHSTACIQFPDKVHT